MHWLWIFLALMWPRIGEGTECFTRHPGALKCLISPVKESISDEETTNKKNLVTHLKSISDTSPPFTVLEVECEAGGDLGDVTELISAQELAEIEALTLKSCRNNGSDFYNAVEGNLQNLQKLDIHRTSLPKEAFKDNWWCRLAQLNVSYSIVDINEEACRQVASNLQTLSIKSSEVRSLEISHFKSLRQLSVVSSRGLEQKLSLPSSLEILDLSESGLTSLEGAQIGGLVNLTKLFVRKNQLLNFPSEVLASMTRLLILDVSDNAISRLNLSQINSTLAFLNLAGNRLTDFSQHEDHQLNNLKILDVSRNLLTDFAQAAPKEVLPQLRILNLSDNQLTELKDDTLQFLYQVQKLDLSNNDIRSVDLTSLPDTLTELNLSGNLIEPVHSLQCSDALQKIDLSSNRIRVIRNGVFGYCAALKTLLLQDNRIEAVEERSLLGLEAIEIINLSQNKLLHMPRHVFSSCLYLSALRLDSNELTVLGDELHGLESLKWLNASRNNLTEVDWRDFPSSLKWLDLQGNAIEAVHNRAAADFMLETLDLSHNSLRTVYPNTVPDSVSFVDLNDNQINRIEPESFQGKRILEKLDLFANELVHLSSQSLQFHPHLRSGAPSLFLGGNPFICDCQLQWLREMSDSIDDASAIYCQLNGTITPLVEARGAFLCQYRSHCFDLCHCCQFDACDCHISCPASCSCFRDISWTTNVVDCTGRDLLSVPDDLPIEASEARLDGNHFTHLAKDSLIARRRLKTLYLNSSRILTVDRDALQSCTILEELHLDWNGIEQLAPETFSYQSKTLQRLYLHNNRLYKIPSALFLGLENLKILTLSGNKLKTLPLPMINTAVTLNSLHLQKNPWNCSDCIWVNKLRREPQIFDRDSFDCQLEEICPLSGDSLSSTILLVAITMGILLFLTIVLILMCCVFRSSLQWILYKNLGIRWGKPKHGKTSSGSGDSAYDAMVIYSPKDHTWVHQNLVQELEMKPPHFSLFLQSGSVMDAGCEITFVILSRNFFRNQWNQYQFRSQYHNLFRLRTCYFVLMEDLARDEIDPNLRIYMNKKNVIRWKSRDFHLRLRYILPSSPNRTSIYKQHHFHNIYEEPSY